jgi:GTP-binding protein
LKVLSADFVTSAAASGTGIPRDALPHVAIAGRSNVGKSSLINALTRRRIARTSAAPGKTRLANIYRVEIEGAGPGRFGLYLVDLPGYGYARGGADAAAELAAVAETYFRGHSSYVAPGLSRASRDADAGLKPGATYTGNAGATHTGKRHALLLIDARHPGLDADVQAAGWLDSMDVSTHIVATKIDKLTRSERARNLKAIGDTFGMAALPVSAASGEGMDELWRMIIRIGRDADRDE